MKRYLQLITAALLGAMLTGCFDVPVADKLYTDKGISLAPSCKQPPLVALAEQPLPRNFSVVVWNLYKAQRANWQEGMARFVKGQDLVLLQEASAASEVDTWLKQNGGHWQQMMAFNRAGVSFGVMTMAKTAQAFVCGVRTPEPWFRLPKSALVSLYPLQDDPDGLLVINVHSINFELGMAAFREQLSDVTRLARRHQGPIILAGDFNTWSEKRQVWLDKVVNELGLQEALPEPDVRRKAFGRPLDHLYYRSLELQSVSTEATTSSDHNPILLRFNAQSLHVQ